MIARDEPQNCPYVGLEPFDKAHELYFFGRRQDSRILADHVRARKLTVLYGGSGTGKSSILNVGLRAQLRRSNLIVAVLRDWQDPRRLQELAIKAVLAELSDKQRARLPRRVREGRARRGFLALIKRLKRPLLLVLDQFEEYFLYRKPARMSAIEIAIGEFVARRDLPFHLLLSLRDDSLHRLDELRAVVPGILDTTIKLGHLSDSGVEEAIRGPINQYNKEFRSGRNPISIEDELVSVLLKQLKEAETGLGSGDVASTAERQIELSYLQLTLTKLWSAEGGAEATCLRAMTLTGDLGGVRRIVRDHVKNVMQHLTADEQQLCARIFDRLVTGIGSKIAYPTSGLAADEVSGPEVDQTMLQQVLQKLTPKETRILRPVMTNGLPGFELFHDVLGLPVLEWKRSFQADARRREELAEAEAQKRHELAEAERQLAEAERQKAYELSAAEARRQKEKNFRTKIAALVFACLSIVALLALFFAYQKGNQALVEARKAANELIAAEQARGYAHWTNFSSGNRTLSQQEITALWQIISFLPENRQGFIAPLLLNPPDNAVLATLGKRPEQIVRSLGLLWPLSEEAARVFHGILLAGVEMTEPGALLGWAQTLSALKGKFPAEQSSLALTPILSALNRSAEQTAKLMDIAHQEKLSTSPLRDRARPLTQGQEETLEQQIETIMILAEALEALPETRSTPQIARTLEATVLLVSKATSGFSPSVFMSSRLFRAIVPRASTDQVNSSIEDILQRLSTTKDLTSLRALMVGLQVLKKASIGSGEIPPQKLQPVLDTILVSLESRSYSSASELFDLLVAISPNLESDQASRALDSMLARSDDLMRNTDAFEKFQFNRAVEALSAKLTADQANAIIIAAVLPTLRSKPNNLDNTFKALAARLDNRHAQPILNNIFDSYQSTSDPKLRLALAKAMATLPISFTSEEAGIILEPILSDLARNSYQDASNLLEQVAEKLPSGPAQAALNAALKGLLSDEMLEGDIARSLARSAKTIMTKLAPEETRVDRERILGSFTSQPNTSTIIRLAPLLPTLAPAMTDAQRAATADAVLKALLKTVEPNAISTLAGSLWELSSALTPEQAKQASDYVFESFRNAPPRAIQPLIWSFRGLPVQLTPEQAKIVLDKILVDLSKGSTSSLYGTLETVLQQISLSLTSDQALSFLDQFLPAIADEDLIRNRQRLDEVVKMLIGKLDEAQSRKALEVAREQLALSGNASSANRLASVIAALAKPLPDDAFFVTIVDTLKYPTAAGQPTDILLTALSKRFPGAYGADKDFFSALVWLKGRPDAASIAQRPQRSARSL